MRLLFVPASALLVWAMPEVASAQAGELDPEAMQCVSDHEAAQVENGKGRLVDALRLARSCARPSCPDLVRGFCVKLADEYERQLPTISVRVRGSDGCDTTDARVFVDGAVVADRSAGQATPLDPGKRVVKVEVAGVPAEEQTIVATRGEAARILRFGEARADRCGVTPAAPRPLPPLREPESAGLSGMTIGGIVVGSLSLAALATSAALGIVGLTERADLEACRPCTEEQVDDVRRYFVVGDVFLGVGGATAITSVVLLVLGTAAPEPAGASTTTSGVTLRIGPLGAGLEGAF